MGWFLSEDMIASLQNTLLIFDEGTISKTQLKNILFKIGYNPLKMEDIDEIVSVSFDNSSSCLGFKKWP